MTEQEVASFAQYGKHFQEKTLQSLLSDHIWAEQMMEVFSAEYFDQRYLRFLADHYFKHWLKYRSFPSLKLLVSIIKDELRASSDAVLKEQIINYIQRVKSDPDTGDLKFVKEKALDFCRRQALKAALEKSVDLIVTDKYESVVDVIKKAVTVGTTPATGLNFFENGEERFEKIARHCIPTGIPEFDKKEILDGGIGKGELFIVAGGAGAGKCSHSKTRIRIRYEQIKINGRKYRPWQRISTKRGVVFAKDIRENDELIQ